MALIKQSVKGLFRQSNVEMNDSDVAILSAIMEGEISRFDHVASGGTDVMTPATMRSMKIGVSRKPDGLSATVTLKHIKAGKHVNDVFAHKAIFDADYKSTLSANGIRMIYQGVK